MISYKTWIKNYESLNTPLGDLSRDIGIDRNFPISKSQKCIIEYLNISRAIDAVIHEFNKSWVQYKRDSKLGYQMLEYGLVDNKLYVLFSPTRATNDLVFYIKTDKANRVYSYKKLNDYKTRTMYEHFIELDNEYELYNDDIQFITKKEYEKF